MSQDRPFTILAFPRTSVNPYIELLHTALEQQGVTALNGTRRNAFSADYELAHYHWADYFLNHPERWKRWRGFLRFLIILLVIKVRGKRVIWTMHDLQSHEEQGNFLPRLYRLIFFSTLDGIIALSAESAQIMLTRYPPLQKKPLLQSRIGDYRTLYPHPPSSVEAKVRAGYSPDTFVIGAFGSIRPYKNFPHLMRVFDKLADPALRLNIAGACRDDALQEELTTLATQDPRITLSIQFVPDDELVWLVRASDLVVLPFGQILNSSSTLFALSLNIPVLVPAKASLIEIANNVGPAWVRTYTGELTPAILTDAIAWAKQPRSTEAPLDYYDWEKCGQETAEFMRTLLRTN